MKILYIEFNAAAMVLYEIAMPPAAHDGFDKIGVTMYVWFMCHNLDGGCLTFRLEFKAKPYESCWFSAINAQLLRRITL